MPQPLSEWPDNQEHASSVLQEIALLLYKIQDERIQQGNAVAIQRVQTALETLSTTVISSHTIQELAWITINEASSLDPSLGDRWATHWRLPHIPKTRIAKLC